MSKNFNKPNIIYILSDDMGYGDTGCYGAIKVKTPNIDKLARQGMRFTDAHAPSAVCTPSRYGILTGRYCWRSSLKSGVLKGFSPALIEKNRMTAASLLKKNGYSTACIGKWHLGLGWQMDDAGNVDFSKNLTDSPLDHGFDYYFGISASLNMEPYCFIENDHTVGIPSIPKWPVERGQNPMGLMVPGWRDDLVNTEITRRAVDYIKNNKENRFFLYLPLSGPHNPWVPCENFKGSSEAGLRGDMIQEADWSVGQIMNALEEEGISDNSIVIYTSDNGPHSFDIDEREVYGHDQTAGLRGQKADIWDGGHRVPYIVRWPGRVPEGSLCEELVELTDFVATCADIIGIALPADIAEDSISHFSLLFGEQPVRPVREWVVSHSIRGMFSIRTKRWKFIDGKHSGGFKWKQELESQPDVPEGQLYDMENDWFEKNNLFEQRADITEQLRNVLEQIKNGDSSRGMHP